MRAFRLYRRSVKSGRVDKHRDYIGIEALQKHCPDTYRRYDHYDKWDCYLVGHNYISIPKENAVHITYPELCEKIDGKWVKLSQKEVDKLLNLEEDVV